MSDGRRRLLDGLPPAPPVEHTPPSEVVAEAAQRNGFGYAIEPVREGAGPIKRVRKSVGRTHPLNVRLKPATVATIMGIANDRDIPVAQVIEELIDMAGEEVARRR